VFQLATHNSTLNFLALYNTMWLKK
jgi:hypothetical protein